MIKANQQTDLDYRGDRSTAMFRQLIRPYNSCFAFTSMGAKIDASINSTPGPYVFRVSGQNYHRIGSLLPVDDKQPSFTQLYIYDGAAPEINMRTNAVLTVDTSQHVKLHGESSSSKSKKELQR